MDFGEGVAVSRVTIFNRNDGDANHAAIVSAHLSNSEVSLLNYQGNTLKTYRIWDATDIPVFDINFDSTITTYCGNNACTQAVWDTKIDVTDGQHPLSNGCGGRITYLQNQGYTLPVACTKVASEFPAICVCATSNGDATLVRHVRVQLKGTNFLSLREVEVFDRNEINRALFKPATQSSTFYWNGVSPRSASIAVDGIINTDPADVTHTLSDAGKISLCFCSCLSHKGSDFYFFFV